MPLIHLLLLFMSFISIIACDDNPSYSFLSNHSNSNQHHDNSSFMIESLGFDQENQETRHVYSVYASLKINDESIISNQMMVMDAKDTFIRIPQRYKRIILGYINTPLFRTYFIRKTMHHKEMLITYYSCRLVNVDLIKSLLPQITLEFPKRGIALYKDDMFLRQEDIDDERIRLTKEERVFAIVFYSQDEVRHEQSPWVIGKPILKRYSLKNDIYASVITLYSNGNWGVDRDRIVVIDQMVCFFYSALLSLCFFGIQLLLYASFRIRRVKEINIDDLASLI